jgi:orotate phosphoribosyltransferase
MTDPLLGRNISPDPVHISREYYDALLARLLATARAMTPAVDCVVGIKRSGLFPAVYLSHQLKVGMFTNSELANFPYPRLSRPLIVDTNAWSGGSLRRVIYRLERSGVTDIRCLVMFARANPFPQVPSMTHLETIDRIPSFWYDAP